MISLDEWHLSHNFYYFAQPFLLVMVASPIFLSPPALHLNSIPYNSGYSVIQIPHLIQKSSIFNFIVESLLRLKQLFQIVQSGFTGDTSGCKSITKVDRSIGCSAWKRPFFKTMTLAPPSAAVIAPAFPAPPVPKTATSALRCSTEFTCSIFLPISLQVKAQIALVNWFYFILVNWYR